MWKFLKGLIGLGGDVATASTVKPWLIGGAITAGVILLIGSFTAGWMVNGWRLGKEAEAGRADRAESSLTATAAVLDRATALADRLGGYARDGLAREQAITNAAKDGQNAIKTYLAAHDGCRVTGDDADLLRRNAEARRAAAGAAAPYR